MTGYDENGNNIRRVKKQKKYDKFDGLNKNLKYLIYNNPKILKRLSIPKGDIGF